MLAPSLGHLIIIVTAKIYVQRLLLVWNGAACLKFWWWLRSLLASVHHFLLRAMRIWKVLSFIVKISFIGFDLVRSCSQSCFEVDRVKKLRPSMLMTIIINFPYLRLLLQDMQFHYCRCVIYRYIHSHVEKGSPTSLFAGLMMIRALSQMLMMIVVIPLRHLLAAILLNSCLHQYVLFINAPI